VASIVLAVCEDLRRVAIDEFDHLVNNSIARRQNKRGEHKDSEIEVKFDEAAARVFT